MVVVASVVASVVDSKIPLPVSVDGELNPDVDGALVALLVVAVVITADWVVVVIVVPGVDSNIPLPVSVEWDVTNAAAVDRRAVELDIRPGDSE